MHASFHPLSLPVLETTLENLDHIVRKEDDRCAAHGVIVTSARAVVTCANTGTYTDWRPVRSYAVGPANATMLARLSNPPRDVRGTESGTAERLGHFIVLDAARNERLLYLTGDKTRIVTRFPTW